MALAGCGSSSNSGAAAAAISPPGEAAVTPPYTPVTSFTFVRHTLPGVYGSAVFASPAPPYLVGTVNDGHGNLNAIDLTAIGMLGIYTWPRVPYDIRAADFNGDGIPDVISTVYTPTSVSSWAYLYFGNADGTYTQDNNFGMQNIGPEGAGYRGRTETIVVADFNNDGAVDIFLPTYTFLDATHDLAGDPTNFEHAGAPPNVYNAPQAYLLLNDGTGQFIERAVIAGIGMHSTLSGLTPASTDPLGVQPEGAQAVDFNMDGLIDLYVGGHLFINQGIDDQGVPHFKDMAADYGLTPDVLRAAPPWAPGVANTIPAYALLTDEGAKFLDWNNDGRLDLLLFRWNWGSAHGSRLFEFTGTKFVEREQALTGTTATCTHPASGNVPFFYSTRPTSGTGGASGVNAYDLDNDGLEDVLATGDTSGSTVFRNTGCGFVEVSIGDLNRPGGDGAMALADIDGDGSMDVVYPAVDGVAYYENTTPQGYSFTVDIVGPNGERNQFGRVMQVFPPGSTQIYTRVVDGGSGYLTQNQYTLLVGTSFTGAHNVKVYFAPLTKCSYGGPPCQAAVLNFSISPGQHALAYAPSAAHPNGVAVLN